MVNGVYCANEPTDTRYCGFFFALWQDVRRLCDMEIAPTIATNDVFIHHFNQLKPFVAPFYIDLNALCVPVKQASCERRC